MDHPDLTITRVHATPLNLPVTMGGRSTSSTYQFTLKADNQADLKTWVQRLSEQMKQDARLTDVDDDQTENGVETFIDIDRDRAAQLGVTTSAINSALYNAFGQRLISTIFTQSSQYRVVLEAAPQFQQGPASLSQIYVATSTGAPVPLTSIAQVGESNALLSIERLGQFPAATISFNLAPGAALSDAVEAISGAQAKLGMPASIENRYQGAARAFQASLSSTLWLRSLRAKRSSSPTR